MTLASAYSRILDFAAFRHIADEVGAYSMELTYSTRLGLIGGRGASKSDGFWLMWSRAPPMSLVLSQWDYFEQ
ncbi:MAG: hypothetical protein R2865_00860 [Deinococcales bacterium]